MGARLASGESASSLAREYGVSKAAVSKRVSERVKQLQATAGLVVQAETAMQKLTVSEQVVVQSLANNLLAISNSLASAAVNGAATAHHLSGIAHTAALEVTGVPTDEAGMQALKGIAALIRTGNDAGAMGIDLVKGNREAMTPAPAPLKRRTLSDFYADTGTE